MLQEVITEIGQLIEDLSNAIDDSKYSSSVEIPQEQVKEMISMLVRVNDKVGNANGIMRQYAYAFKAIKGCMEM